MIRVTDITLLEAHCSYAQVCEIMNKDAAHVWMLRTDMTISSGGGHFSYKIHMWNNGDVYINDTNRPLNLDIPDDDLRELSEWCDVNGWNTPIVDRTLLEDTRDFQFWMRMYNAGLVYAPQLKEHEQEEHERFKQLAGDLSDDDQEEI